MSQLINTSSFIAFDLVQPKQFPCQFPTRILVIVLFKIITHIVITHYNTRIILTLPFTIQHCACYVTTEISHQMAPFGMYIHTVGDNLYFFLVLKPSTILYCTWSSFSNEFWMPCFKEWSGGSMLAFHAAGPDSIPGRDKFPG